MTKETLTIKKPADKKTTASKETVEKKSVKAEKVEKAEKAVKNVKEPKTTKTTKEAKAEKVVKTEKAEVKVVKKPVVKKTTDNTGKIYATGKRKNAIAKVWIKKGSGKITINDKTASEYLKRPILEVIINTPFVVTDTQEKFDVICSVLGGGLSGQAGAIRHGISKALELYNKEAYRKDLKSAGLLTRDSRIVERKKAGLKKARKGQVFSKR